MLTLRYHWLDSHITVQRGHRKKIWEASGWFSKKPQDDVQLTIRHLRALFALTDNDYQTFAENNLPAAHEFFCKHKHLQQINHQDMQNFIKGMALMKHFSVRP